MAVVTFHKKCNHQGVFSGRVEAQGDITPLKSRHLLGVLRHFSSLCNQRQLVLNEAETNQDTFLVEVGILP